MAFSLDKDELTRFSNKSSMSYGLFHNLKYQRAIGNKFSLGLNGKYFFYRYQTGTKFDLFSRFYPLGVLEYFYFQGKISAGKHSIFMNYTLDGDPATMRDGIQKTYKKVIWGGGVDIGLHIPMSKSKRLFIDFNFGYNYYPFPKDIPLTIEQNGRTYYSSDEIIQDDYFSTDKIIGVNRWNYWVFGAGTEIDLTFTLGWIL